MSDKFLIVCFQLPVLGRSKSLVATLTPANSGDLWKKTSVPLEVCIIGEDGEIEVKRIWKASTSHIVFVEVADEERAMSILEKIERMNGGASRNMLARRMQREEAARDNIEESPLPPEVE